MKYWLCPKCKRVRIFFKHIVMKVCTACQCEMVLKDDKEGTIIGNGRK